jgi:hypothetical protein
MNHNLLYGTSIYSRGQLDFERVLTSFELVF